MVFDRHTIHRCLTFCGFPHSGALEHIWEHSYSFIGSAVIEILFSYVTHILPHLCISWWSRFQADDQRRLTLLPQSAHTVSQRSNRAFFAIKKASIPFPSLHVFFLFLLSFVHVLVDCLVSETKRLSKSV